MSNVGIGDILFIILVLGIIHGIMHWISRSRASKRDLDAGSAEH